MDESASESSHIAAGESLAAILRRIIRSSGYGTQEALARALGVTQGTISNYLREKSLRSPSPTNIRRIAKLCARSAEECVRYEQAMLQARARQQFPGLLAPVASPVALPPEEFSLLFRNRVREDLAKWPLRRWRGMVQRQGLTWRLVQRMLDGRGVMTVDEVRALARALRVDEHMYLMLMRAPSEQFYQRVAGQRELWTALSTLPRLSEQDIKTVLGQLAHPDLPDVVVPRRSRQSTARTTAQKKPLRRGR